MKTSVFLAPAACALTALSLFAAAPTAHAATAAFTAGGDGNQGFGGSLGMTFVVIGADSIEVTSLGAFDHLGDGFKGGTITVKLFEATAYTSEGGASPYDNFNQTGTDVYAYEGFELASLSFDLNDGTSGGTSGFVYKNLAAPITLNTSSVYVIVASGFNAVDLERNSVTALSGVAPQILIGANGYDGNPGVIPQAGNGYHSETGVSGIYGGHFAAGSFEYNVLTQAPEPSTMMLGGLGALALLRRRRH